MVRWLPLLVLFVPVLGLGQEHDHYDHHRNPNESPGLFQGTERLPHLTSVSIAPIPNLPAGTSNLYTAPAATRSYPWMSIYNPTNASITFNVRLSKDGGVTYIRVGRDVVVTAGSTSAIDAALIMEPGDILALYANAPGLALAGMAQEFSSSAKIRQVIFTSFTAGDNTVYTCCPAGMTHAVIPISEVRGPFDDTAGQMFLSNETGLPVTIAVKLKPSASVPFQVVNSTTVGNDDDSSVNGNLFQTVLSKGESLVVNSSSGAPGQAFRCNAYEF